MQESNECVEIKQSHNEEMPPHKHDINDNIEIRKEAKVIVELKNEWNDGELNLKNDLNDTFKSESDECKFEYQINDADPFKNDSKELTEVKDELNDTESYKESLHSNINSTDYENGTSSYEFKNVVKDSDDLMSESRDTSFPLESAADLDNVVAASSLENDTSSSFGMKNITEAHSASFKRLHRLPKLDRFRNTEYDELPGKPLNSPSSENIRFHSSPAIGNKKLLRLRKVLSQPLLKYPIPNPVTDSESSTNIENSSVNNSSNVESLTINNFPSTGGVVINNYESSNIILPGLLSSPKIKYMYKNRSTSLPLISFSPVKVVTRTTSTSLTSSQSSQNILPPIKNEIKSPRPKSSTHPKDVSPKTSNQKLISPKIVSPKVLSPRIRSPRLSSPVKTTSPNASINPSISKLENVIDTETVTKDENQSSSKRLSVVKKERVNTLPPIAVKDVKHRSYLLGNLSKKNALLGSLEMQRYLPTRKIRVLVATWNVNSVLTDESLDNMLLPHELEHVPDMYAVGVQEATSQREEWEIRIQETIGPSHVMFHSEVFGTLHISIFLRRDLIWFCSIPETSTVSTRLGAKFKTKGAVAISFAFFGTTFLFISSHFTANEDKVQERIMDYKKISTTLNLPRNVPIKLMQQTTDITEHFDRVFWFGDFNFRINRERRYVLAIIEQMTNHDKSDFAELLRDDELFKNMKAGNIFVGFQEGPISFLPTYKYDVGTHCFDTSMKLRIPSYTDRILYRSKRSNYIKCLAYNSANTFKDSDHKPVYGIFEVAIKPGRDNVPLAAGQFNREVYLTALERRSQQMDLLVKPRPAACSSVCSVM